MTRPRLTTPALVSFALSLLGAPLACVGTTGGEKFEFEAVIGGIERNPEVPYTFLNEYGWTVSLSQADLTVGPLYLNTIAPLGGISFLQRWLPVREARAHSAHLGEGRIVGEVLGRVRFDALSPSLISFPARGVISTDEVRSAEVWFYPPADVPPETVKISGAALEVAGEAERGQERVRFRGRLVLDDDWLPASKPGDRDNTPITAIRQVRGIPARFVPSPGGRLEVRVALAPLFASADFSNLARNPPDPEDPQTRALVQSKTGKYTTDQVMRVIYQGLRAASGTYTVTWRP
ncbi:MAG: hypothetical protein RMJ98_00180 [Myxococcales bacterium]|nr:hypothetical protein [Polyangiaceae bacterium]MDW8247703.1 hypothetical protein [Myxococcales bacterium]